MEAALRLLSRFLAGHPHEATMALETQPAAEAAAILADQLPDLAAPVWRRMSIPAAAAALGRMELPSAVALLCRVAAPAAALVLARQSLPAAITMARACPEPWRTAIERASHVGALSVGALMHPAPTAFPVDWTVRQCGEFVLKHPEFLTSDLFVVDREWRLVGRTDLQRLAGSGGGQSIGGLMQPNPQRLLARDAVAAVRENLQWQGQDVLPVTDAGGLLVGALPHRRLRSLDGKARLEPGAELRSVLVEAVELAWAGFAGAIEAVATAARELPRSEERP